MFYKAKVAVCSEIRTKHINAMWAPRRIFLILTLVVRKVIARFQKVKGLNISLMVTVAIRALELDYLVKISD
jgi:hypothetical protein